MGSDISHKWRQHCSSFVRFQNPSTIAALIASKGAVVSVKPLLSRMAAECAEAHPDINLGDIWEQSSEWERVHANSRELEDRAPDMEPLWQAIDYYKAEDIDAALKIWFDLAREGSVWSMFEIGRCYEYGRGVARNPAEAENWYK